MPNKVASEVLKAIWKLHKKGVSPDKISQQLKVSRATVRMRTSNYKDIDKDIAKRVADDYVKGVKAQVIKKKYSPFGLSRKYTMGQFLMRAGVKTRTRSVPPTILSSKLPPAQKAKLSTEKYIQKESAQKLRQAARERYQVKVDKDKINLRRRKQRARRKKEKRVGIERLVKDTKVSACANCGQGITTYHGKTPPRVCAECLARAVARSRK